MMRTLFVVALMIAAAALGAVVGVQGSLHQDAHDDPAAASRLAARSATDRCLPILAGETGPRAGMAWVEPATFTLGDDAAFPEESPARSVTVEGFWMDRTEVTNQQFAAFVAATGYRTRAEREGRSAVFEPPRSAAELETPASWWHARVGANWRHPEGPGSDIVTRGQHPVVHIAFEDAQAYAQWKGHALPTEAQFERAAQGAARKGAQGYYTANTWQGSFPARDTAADGHAGTAPVGCFEANRQGLHDLVGNVWEWTRSAYFPRHDAADGRHPDGYDPAQPDETQVNVVKGGSWLCAPDYCMRYRPAARIGHSPTLPAGHIGFRTVHEGDPPPGDR